MKKITSPFPSALAAALLGVSFLVSAPLQAQEDPFSTVITPAFSPITWERLVNADDEPENWLMYSGTLDSQRYSLLDQINVNNVDQLEMKWAYQIPVIDRAETVPLVVDGIMFITEAPSNVVKIGDKLTVITEQRQIEQLARQRGIGTATY